MVSEFKIINRIKIPIITEKPKLLVPNVSKFRDIGAIGTMADFFIKEILYAKYRNKVYQYNFYRGDQKDSKIEKSRLIFQNRTQENFHNFLLSIKYTQVSNKIIQDYIRIYYRHSRIVITEEQIQSAANEVMSILSNVDLSKLEAKNYLLINPIFGYSKPSRFPQLSLKQKTVLPDLIIDDTIIDIKVNSRISLGPKFIFQLLNYLIWFEYSRKYLGFALPIKKIGIFYVRFDFLFTIDLVEVFSKCDFSLYDFLRAEITYLETVEIPNQLKSWQQVLFHCRK